MRFSFSGYRLPVRLRVEFCDEHWERDCRSLPFGLGIAAGDVGKDGQKADVFDIPDIVDRRECSVPDQGMVLD